MGEFADILIGEAGSRRGEDKRVGTGSGSGGGPGSDIGQAVGGYVGSDCDSLAGRGIYNGLMTGGEETFVKGHSNASRCGSSGGSINFDMSGEYGGFASKPRRYMFLKGGADGSGSGGGSGFGAEGGGGESRGGPRRFVGHIGLEGEACECCGVRGNFTGMFSVGDQRGKTSGMLLQNFPRGKHGRRRSEACVG